MMDMYIIQTHIKPEQVFTTCINEVHIELMNEDKPTNRYLVQAYSLEMITRATATTDEVNYIYMLL